MIAIFCYCYVFFIVQSTFMLLGMLVRANKNVMVAARITKHCACFCPCLVLIFRHDDFHSTSFLFHFLCGGAEERSGKRGFNN